MSQKTGVNILMSSFDIFRSAHLELTNSSEQCQAIFCCSWEAPTTALQTATIQPTPQRSCCNPSGSPEATAICDHLIISWAYGPSFRPSVCAYPALILTYSRKMHHISSLISDYCRDSANTANSQSGYKGNMACPQYCHEGNGE